PRLNISNRSPASPEACSRSPPDVVKCGVSIILVRSSGLQGLSSPLYRGRSAGLSSAEARLARKTRSGGWTNPATFSSSTTAKSRSLTSQAPYSKSPWARAISTVATPTRFGESTWATPFSDTTTAPISSNRLSALSSKSPLQEAESGGSAALNNSTHSISALDSSSTPGSTDLYPSPLITTTFGLSLEAESLSQWALSTAVTGTATLQEPSLNLPPETMESGELTRIRRSIALTPLPAPLSASRAFLRRSPWVLA